MCAGQQLSLLEASQVLQPKQKILNRDLSMKYIHRVGTYFTHSSFCFSLCLLISQLRESELQHILDVAVCHPDLQSRIKSIFRRLARALNW